MPGTGAGASLRRNGQRGAAFPAWNPIGRGALWLAVIALTGLASPAADAGQRPGPSPEPSSETETPAPVELWSQFPLGEPQRAEPPTAPVGPRPPAPPGLPAAAPTPGDSRDDISVPRALFLVAALGGLLLALALAFVRRAPQTAGTHEPHSAPLPSQPATPPAAPAERVDGGRPPSLDGIAAEEEERRQSLSELQSVREEASGYVRLGTDELGARAARLEQLVADVLAQDDRDVAKPREPTRQPDAETAVGCLLFVPTDEGYSLVGHEGEAPAPGSVVNGVELGVDGSFYVARLGPSPLPSDSRRCAYLERR